MKIKTIPPDCQVADSQRVGAAGFPRWLLLCLLAFAVVMFGCQMYVYGEAGSDGDTYSYLRAWDLLKGMHTDLARPPIYPAFIGITMSLFGVWLGNIVTVVLQWALWVYAVVCLFRVSVALGVGRRWSAVLGCLMMVIPGCWVYNNVILAESVSASCVIILFYNCCRLVEMPDAKRAAWVSALVIMLIFIKQVFIFLLPIMAVFWVVLSRRACRKVWLTGCAGLVVAVGLVLAYMAVMAKAHYLHGVLTEASVMNKYHLLRRNGLILPDEIEDEECRELFRPLYEADPGSGKDVDEGWVWYWDEIWMFNPIRLQAITDHAYELHRAEANRAILRRFPQTLMLSMMRQKDKWAEFVIFSCKYIELPFWVGWAISLMYSCWGLMLWRRRRKFPLVEFLPVAMLVANYVSAFVGAMDDWARLVYPTMACLMFMAVALAAAVSPWVRSSLRR